MKIHRLERTKEPGIQIPEFNILELCPSCLESENEERKKHMSAGQRDAA